MPAAGAVKQYCLFTKANLEREMRQNGSKNIEKVEGKVTLKSLCIIFISSKARRRRRQTVFCIHKDKFQKRNEKNKRLNQQEQSQGC